MFAQKMKIYSILCLTRFKQKLDKPCGLFLPERCVRTRVSMMQLQDLHLYLNITLPLVFFIYLLILRTESTFSLVFCFRNRREKREERREALLLYYIITFVFFKANTKPLKLKLFYCLHVIC